MSAPSWPEVPAAATPAPSRSTSLGLRVAIAVVTAVALAWSAAALGADRTTLLSGLQLALLAVACWLSVIDVREHRLPDRITLPAAAATLAVLVVVDLATQGPVWGVTTGSLAVGGMLGGLAMLVAFGALALFGTMGLGDAKLAGMLGAVLLPLHGVESLLVTFAAAYVLALPHAVVLTARRRRGGARRDLPFGPYLLAGALVAVVTTGAWAGLLWPVLGPLNGWG